MDMFSYLLGRSSGGGGKGSLKVAVVEELPETGEANVLYLVPRQVSKYRNVFDEYLYIDEDWEKVGTTDIDISGKQDKMQFDTMPTVSSSDVGKIVQYIGATTANYTNGYFYQVISDGEETPTYSWTNVEVQSSSSAGGNDGVVITASNYQDSDIVAALNEQYQKYLNGETYNVWLEHQRPAYENSKKYTLPAIFSTNTSGTSLSMITLQYVDYNMNEGGLYLLIQLSSWARISNGVITLIGQEPQYRKNYIGGDGGSSNSFFLKSQNTYMYTPTGDYNPSTKLYTDKTHYENMTGYDATKTQVLKNINGTLTWVDEA